MIGTACCRQTVPTAGVPYFTEGGITMELETLIENLREEASDVGLFFPMLYDTDALNTAGELHGHKLSSRRIL